MFVEREEQPAFALGDGGRYGGQNSSSSSSMNSVGSKASSSAALGVSLPRGQQGNQHHAKDRVTQPSTLQERPIDTLGANFGVVVPESSADRPQQGLPELAETNIANRMTCNSSRYQHSYVKQTAREEFALYYDV